ncbi:MAG: thioredoxin family protein [Phycisphaeraceae bacterium]|nr:MAG: thioredoxin family protein [Phycisphaeraceae bacterium]
MPPASSTMLELGTTAPAFSLPDFGIDGNNGARTISLDDLPADQPLLVMFICNHCPFVVHVRDELAKLGRDYAGVSIVAINSNNVETHPDDAPDKMAATARQAGFTFPYLFDESQEVAKAYTAACTPDYFLFGSDRKLAYRGQLDDSRPGNGMPVTGADLRAAIGAVLSGKAVEGEQRPSMGCSIKWKPGNAPS